MDQFFKSTAGRLMALSFAIALIGGSASALMHHGEAATFTFCLSLFIPIVLNVGGLPTALEQDWYHAVIAVVTLPMLLFLWAIGLGVIREFHPGYAYPFIALGLAALGLAARPAHRASIATSHFAEQH
jgi:hypothetical protein